MSLETKDNTPSIIVREGEFHSQNSGGDLDNSRTTQKPKSVEIDGFSRVKDIDFTGSDINNITIVVKAFSDGRAFSLARQFRTSGFRGNLRAKGPMIADQYPLAIRCGFDEVEISGDEALRQPENQWVEALGRTNGNYLSRLMA